MSALLDEVDRELETRSKVFESDAQVTCWMEVPERSKNYAVCLRSVFSALFTI